VPVDLSCIGSPHRRTVGDHLAFGPRESRSPNASGLAPPPAASGAFRSFVTDRLSNSVLPLCREDRDPSLRSG